MVGLQARRLSLGLAAMVAVWSLGFAPALALTGPVITSAPPSVGTVDLGYLHPFQVSPHMPEPHSRSPAAACRPGGVSARTGS